VGIRGLGHIANGDSAGAQAVAATAQGIAAGARDVTVGALGVTVGALGVTVGARGVAVGALGVSGGASGKKKFLDGGVSDRSFPRHKSADPAHAPHCRSGMVRQDVTQDH
jgi:hypothetical protein